MYIYEQGNDFSCYFIRSINDWIDELVYDEIKQNLSMKDRCYNCSDWTSLGNVSKTKGTLMISYKI